MFIPKKKKLQLSTIIFEGNWQVNTFLSLLKIAKSFREENQEKDCDANNKKITHLSRRYEVVHMEFDIQTILMKIY